MDQRPQLKNAESRGPQVPNGRGTYNRTSVSCECTGAMGAGYKGDGSNPSPRQSNESCRRRGTMGSGIAQIIAQAGIRTTLMDADIASLERGLEAIASRWERLTATGRRPHEDVAGFRANLSQGKITDAKTADLVIEAITENLSRKSMLFEELAKIFSPSLLSPRTPRRSRSPRLAPPRRPDRSSTPLFQPGARAATGRDRAGPRHRTRQSPRW